MLMKIREAKPSDLNAIYNLAKDDLKDEGWFDKKTLRWVLKINPKLSWVLEDSKRVIGARLSLESWGINVWGWLIVIHKNFRRNGLGRYLFEETCKKIKSKGFKRIMTDVSNKNKFSITWHKKMGYKRSCLAKHWFKKNEHAIIFIKDL